LTTTRLPRRALALFAVPLIALAACGGDDDGSGTAEAATTAEASATTAATTPDSTADDATATTEASTAPSSAAVSTTAAPDIDLSGVTLRVGDQVNITQSGLEAAGLADTPYKIEWAAFPSGPPLLEALAADAIDIGGVGDAPPIFAAAGGAPIRVVLATRTPQVTQGFLVPAGSDVTDIAGLKGKKIAVAKGSSANWILLKGLQDNGLTVDDVEIAYLQPADAQGAFASGDVDAWVIWDPYSALARAQGAQLILSGEELGIPGVGFQVASEASLGDPEKEAAIRDYLGRLRQAQAWQRENKEAWAEKYSELTKLPLDLAKELLQQDTVPVLIDDAMISAQQAEADAFFAAGLIPTEINFAEFADDRFNDIAS
jgi:sulfonate transport system substrate-binding protein